MKMSPQIGEVWNPAAPWVRLAALCAILVLLVCSSLQAAHVHKPPVAGHSSTTTLLTEGSNPGDDAACPLCLIGSSALPAPGGSVQVTLLAWHAYTANAQSRLVPTDLPFARFVRPPPAAA